MSSQNHSRDFNDERGFKEKVRVESYGEFVLVEVKMNVGELRD